MAALSAGNRLVDAVSTVPGAVLSATRFLANVLLLGLDALRATAPHAKDAAGTGARRAHDIVARSHQPAEAPANAAIAREVDRLGAAIRQMEDLAPAAYDVRRAWVGGDARRAKTFAGWVQESAAVSFEDERWRAVAARWRELGWTASGREEPLSSDEQARLAAELIGQIELGWRELQELQQRVDEDGNGALDHAVARRPEPERAETRPLAERLAGVAAAVRRRLAGTPVGPTLFGASVLALLAVLSAAPATGARAVGLPLLVVTLTAALVEALVALARLRKAPPSADPHMPERLAPYLATASGDDREPGSGTEAHDGPSARFDPRAESFPVAWLAVVLLALGLVLSVDAAYARWSGAGSLDAAGLIAVLGLVYAGVFALRTAGRRLASVWPRLERRLDIVALVGALAALGAIAFTEAGRYDDAQAFATSDFAAVAPMSPTFFTRSSRISLSWKPRADVVVDSFDVRVRSAAPSSGLGPHRLWLSGTPRAGSVWAGAPGRTYCFSARAHSRRYGTSPWSPLRCVAVPVDDHRLSRHGRWTSARRSTFFLGTASASYSTGSELVRRVRARRLALLARRCPACGTVAVYLGQRRLQVVSLRGARADQVIRIQRARRPSAGVLRLVVVGGRRPVLIDGIGTSMRP